MFISTNCPMCGDYKNVEVSDIKYTEWMAGRRYVQNLGLSRYDAERLLTGICPICWDEMFCVDELEDATDMGESAF